MYIVIIIISSSSSSSSSIIIINWIEWLLLIFNGIFVIIMF
jgi:hypothetical protein